VTEYVSVVRGVAGHLPDKVLTNDDLAKMVDTTDEWITARTGIKAYQPAFWSLPTTFLTSTAAAGSVGFINSVGNLGGFVGPSVLGFVEKRTGSFQGGIWFLAGMMALAVIIVLLMFAKKEPAKAQAELTPGTTG